MRFLADSNRRKRFCRPVPNHSAKEPFIAVAKVLKKRFDAIALAKLIDDKSIKLLYSCSLMSEI